MPKNLRRSLRAAVVGGGIGGLAVANALMRKGLDVVVYEQAPALAEVGAGVMIYPNSLRHLERMGFRERLASVGARIGPLSAFHRSDGSPVGSFQTTDSTGWNGMYGMHRADILNTLAADLPSGAVLTGHRCVDFRQNSEAATVVFDNGHTAEADLVVAADGINSALRRFVSEPKPPVYSGMRAYRGLVEKALFDAWPDDAMLVWMGDGKHFMVYPVRGGTILNYVGFVPTGGETVESWSAPGDRGQLASSFQGWDKRITTLLSKVESCFWWGLYDREPLDSWTNGRLTLLGDAAHPMLPHLGQGANQAIEDGIALACFLEGTSATDVPAALQAYANLRAPRTAMVQVEARKNGQRYDSRYANLAQRDDEIKSSAAFRKSLFDYDVEKETMWSRQSSAMVGTVSSNV
ncbi:FAD-dependent monooxygenase [Bradyrhizobium betae]|uniref:2-polyprenyl-6-methoxyphenol hydroxylase n=1 Tax=Bradyrhizobium betae TaxID=244734 RepID=A0A4Q1VNT9_9BRAD|nr:FAD-dependent monooxygenase [Bradyrhizobium betae]RXT54258.1 2-polyprenyl-6-methoxyphenol hydroxylase [Bradyrhizobium betae]